MRTRSSGVLQPMGPFYEYDSQGGAVGPLQSSVKFGQSKTTRDVSVPNFANRVARGEVFFNPFYQSIVDWSRPSGSGYGHRSNSTGVEYYTSVFPDSWIGAAYGLTGSNTITIPKSLTDSEIQQLQVEAATAVLSSRGRSNANMWEALAEMDKTAENLKHPIDSFWRTFRKNEKMWASLSTSASNAYLIWRYGISPLIKDVSTVLENLHNGPEPLPIRVSTRKKLEISSSSSVAKTSTAGIYTLGWEASCMDKVVVRAASLDEETVGVGKTLGFDGKSLATLPWELVRYSFVVDWFANVGDYLGALADVVNSNTHLGGCITTERWFSANITLVSSSVSSGWTITRVPSANVVGSEYFKTRSTSLPAPGLAIRGDFRVDKMTRVADALSLIGQRVLPILGTVFPRDRYGRIRYTE